MKLRSNAGSSRTRAIVGLGFVVLSACASAACSSAPTDAPESTESSFTNVDNTLLSPEVIAATKSTALLLDKSRSTVDIGAHGTPIFEPGGIVPALYEVALNPGWAVVTASSPAHVLELGTEGEGPATRLLASAASPIAKVMRLDTALYVGVDADGKANAQSTPTIMRIDRSKSFGAELIEVSADDAIAGWNLARTDYNRVRLERGAGSVDPQWFWNSDPPSRSCTAPGELPHYSQLDPGEGPNTSSCASGCGATAWAIIFGWASQRAYANTAQDWDYVGLFRTGDNALGQVSTAPMYNNGDVGEISWTLREKMGTFCVGDQGATTQWGMDNAADYAASRAPNVSIDVDYDTFMVSSGSIRDKVIDQICAGRPSIIGTGSLFGGNGHYPVAKAYQDGWFWLEMGWGGSSNGWYEASTWFMGAARH